MMLDLNLKLFDSELPPRYYENLYAQQLAYEKLLWIKLRLDILDLADQFGGIRHDEDRSERA